MSNPNLPDGREVQRGIVKLTAQTIINNQKPAPRCDRETYANGLLISLERVIAGKKLSKIQLVHLGDLMHYCHQLGQLNGVSETKGA